MEVESGVMVEGFSNEALITFLLVGVIMSLGAFLLRRWRRRNNRDRNTIHPESQREVDDTRQRLQERRPSTSMLSNGTTANNAINRFRRNVNDNQCPVCLNDAKFAAETNCGHMFCGRCLITYWRHGTWLGAVRCPVCRQQVNILLMCFTESEMNTAEPDEVEERTALIRDIHDYNRRFSGEPLAFLDYIRDLPTLLRHMWNEFFSEGGLMYMFRIRIVLCVIAACLYLVSPLDVIPEAVFGILGLLDDLFVALLLAIYISIVYRRHVTTRAQNANFL